MISASFTYDGGHFSDRYRKEGATAGTYDTYFFNPEGKVQSAASS